MTLKRLRRLAAVDGEELRFRVTGLARVAADRARTAVVQPAWDRRALASLLADAAPSAAREALRSGRWHDGHAALACHFAGRSSAFPLQAPAIPALAATIRREFPSAPADAARRARNMLAGKYDVLGFVDLPFGNPPDWHADPVNDRRAPRTFWASVPFLSPECGDHKIIWELNRHQHWIALGRSRILNDDRACYAAFVSQLEDWLTQNPPLIGINWASMLELAFRSLSWLWALHLFAADALHDTAAQAPWTIDLLVALDRQLTHVERNLSTYFSPNTHLTGEALALYVAGHALPELASSRHRTDVGRQILLNEIDRQVHGDGGHAEMSAHYHRYSTDFYLLALLVARRAGDPAAGRFEEAAARQARYLRTIADDRGMLPLIGDDDGGQTFDVSGREPADASSSLATAAVALADPQLAVGPVAEETLWLCGCDAKPPRSMRANAWASAALMDTGYFVSRTRQGDHLVLDAGRHGYLNAGHAHADALSLVLSLRGTPLLVDPGTGVYTTDLGLRDRLRSSAMHNTIVLDGKPAAEPDGPFHWRSRADAAPTFWHSASGFDYAEGSHGAYAPIRHTRGVLAVHGFGWFVFDHLIGPRGPVTVDAFWHLHPDWTVSVDAEGVARLEHGSGMRTAVATTGGTLRVLDPGDDSGLTLFAPIYGRITETHVLTSREASVLPTSFVTFIAADPSIARGLRLERIGVDAQAGDDWQTLAIELSFGDGVATVLCAARRDPAATSAPRRVWGVEDLRTDGRVAARITRRTEPPLLLAVDGALHDSAREPIVAATSVLEHIS